MFDRLMGWTVFPVTHGVVREYVETGNSISDANRIDGRAWSLKIKEVPSGHNGYSPPSPMEPAGVSFRPRYDRLPYRLGKRHRSSMQGTAWNAECSMMTGAKLITGRE